MILSENAMKSLKSTEPRCVVFMSTYNGENFLVQQIESILNQIGVAIRLKIRDDGSSDRTVEILEKYRTDPRVEIILGDNRGFGESFLRLLYSTRDEYDYYSFSDQDDIWDNDKLYAGHIMMKEIDLPTLYYCSQRIVDEKGNYERDDISLERIANCTMYSASKTNLIRGCTMIWNTALQKQLLNHMPNISMLKEHDIWVSWMALIVGNIVFDKSPHMDYRQCKNSTSPGASMNGKYDLLHKLRVMKYIWHKWRGLKSIYAEQLESVFPEYRLSTSRYKTHTSDKLILLFSRKYNKGVPLKWRIFSDLMIVTNRL